MMTTSRSDIPPATPAIQPRGQVPRDMVGIDSLFADLVERVAAAVVGRLQAAADHRHAEPDRLVTKAEAADRLGVTPAWLSRHAGALPFTRKLGRKTVRFSVRGIERWLTRAGSQVLCGPENDRQDSPSRRRGPRKDPW